MIERCLQLYMNKDEVVKTLLTRARIEPAFTSLGKLLKSLSSLCFSASETFLPFFFSFVESVWQKLEEGNAEFFRAYYIRLKLKKQIVIFNQLLEHQYHLMKYPPVPPKIPLAPMPNGMHHPMPPGNKSKTPMLLHKKILNLHIYK